MGNLSNKSWCCPYYTGSSVTRKGRPTITCGGGTRVSFGTRKQFDEFAERYCCGAWGNCTIAAEREEVE